MNFKTFIIIFLLFAAIGNSAAQDTLVIDRSADRLLLDNQWLNTKNMAGAIFNPFLTDGDFVLGYKSGNGDLKLSQLPSNEQSYSFNTNKTVRLNKFIFTGNVGYLNSQQENVGWTARMNPITLNPYMLADSLYGLYKKDYVFLGGGFGYQISERLLTGINVNYMVADGARIKDPRAQNDLFNIEIFPSAIYIFDKFKLGATLQLLSGREKTSYSTLETSSTYRFFRMFGLGKGAKAVNGWSLTRNYYLSGLGGELQAQYRWGNIEMLSGFAYIYKMEKAEDGSSIPEKSDAGDFKENNSQFYTHLLFGEEFIHSVTFDLGLLIGQGIEFIQEAYSKNTVTYYRTIAETEYYSTLKMNPSLQYKLAKPHNRYSNAWELSFAVKAEYFNAEYLLEAKESYTNISSYIEFEKNFYFKKSMLSISAFGSFNFNLNSELKQLRTFTASQEIAYWNKVIEPDFILTTSNIYSLGADFRYGRRLEVIKGHKNLLYFDFCMDYMSGNNELWSQSKNSEKYCFKIGLTY